MQTLSNATNNVMNRAKTDARCQSPDVVVRTWTQRCRHEWEWVCPLCLEADDECPCGQAVTS
jgi:hypothetical protein